MKILELNPQLLNWILWIPRLLIWLLVDPNWFLRILRIGVVACIVLGVELYIGGMYIGAQKLMVIRSQLEARGTIFDYNKFDPPSIPDDENLAKIQLFETKTTVGPDGQLSTTIPNLSTALSRYYWIPLDDIKSLDETYEKMAKSPVIINSQPLEKFAAIYPFLNELHLAAQTHPKCLFPYKSTQNSDLADISLIIEQSRLDRVLSQQSRLAINQQQSDLALDNFKLILQLASGVKPNPFLISAIIYRGQIRDAIKIVEFGLSKHAWNDKQLAEIINVLEPIDILNDCPFALRSELAAQPRYLELLRTATGTREYQYLESFTPDNGQFDESDVVGWFDFFKLLPGTWDSNMAHLLDYNDRVARNVLTKDHFLNIKSMHDLQKEYEETKQNSVLNVLFTLYSFKPQEQVLTFARAQVALDELRIALSLERYRLANNRFPTSLAFLSNGVQLPLDSINGKPYHYLLKPDGMYLLYSVGWNETDDGGKLVYPNNQNYLSDPQQGDWVWNIKIAELFR